MMRLLCAIAGVVLLAFALAALCLLALLAIATALFGPPHFPIVLAVVLLVAFAALLTAGTALLAASRHRWLP